MTILTAELKAQATALGFNRVGVIPAAPARRLEAYLAWIAAGYHGEMGYLARPDRVARRRDLEVILPGARSLVVVGLDYATAPPPADLIADPSRGRFSNYAWGADYHDVMTPRLEALAGWLEREAQGSRGAGEQGRKRRVAGGGWQVATRARRTHCPLTTTHYPLSTVYANRCNGRPAVPTCRWPITSRRWRAA